MPNYVTVILMIYNFNVYTLLDLITTFSLLYFFLIDFICVPSCYVNPLKCLSPLVGPLLLKGSIGVIPCPYCIKSSLVVLLSLIC